MDAGLNGFFRRNFSKRKHEAIAGSQMRLVVLCFPLPLSRNRPTQAKWQIVFPSGCHLCLLKQNSVARSVRWQASTRSLRPIRLCPDRLIACEFASPLTK